MEALRAHPEYPTLRMDAGGGLWWARAYAGAYLGVSRRGAPPAALQELLGCLRDLPPGAVLRSGGQIDVLDSEGRVLDMKYLLGHGPEVPTAATRRLVWWELR